MAGIAEPEFRTMIKAMGYAWHKYGDVRYCVHCHTPLPKTERMPDYLVCPRPIWIEVKNNDATGRWNWKADIGPEGARLEQRKFLIENNGWLFIEIGIGRRPKDYSAFLLPMNNWVADIEVFLEQSSLPRKDTPRLVGADTIMLNWKLDWEKGHWTIPKGHVWWYYLKSLTEALLVQIEENL